MSAPEPHADREGELSATPEATSQALRGQSSQTTVGIGSALGIGCVIALALFVIVAIVWRWMMGAW